MVCTFLLNLQCKDETFRFSVGLLCIWRLFLRGYVRRFEVISPPANYSIFLPSILCILTLPADVALTCQKRNYCPMMPFVFQINFHDRHTWHSLLYNLNFYSVSVLSSCSIRPRKYKSIRSENTICCFSASLIFLIVYLSPDIVHHTCLFVC